MNSIRIIARAGKTDRIKALSDGVFAIVMTLLVIELAVPEVPKMLAADELHLKLFEMWPKFAAYALSFIMLGITWSYHRIYFQHIKSTNEKVEWINILYLMFVALMPFSTSMIGEYTIFATSAVILFGANMFLIMLMANIQWWYVTKNKHLLNKDISPKEIIQFKIGGWAGALLFLVAIGLSFINPYISIVMYVLSVLWGIIGILTLKTYHSDGEKSKL